MHTIKKKAMIAAMEESLGVVTTAAIAVGINRRTHYEWINSDAEYREAIEDLNDCALDFVESQNYKNIKNGDVASTIFFLKTRGKKRGYSERVEQVQEQSIASKEDKVIAKLDEMIKKLDDIEPDTETENKIP